MVKLINKVVVVGKIWYLFSYFCSPPFINKILITIDETYECKLDDKGRLLMPAPLKKQLTSVLESSFVLKRSVFQPCIELYPMEEWNLIKQKINKLNRFVPKNTDFIRRFTAGVKIVEIDALGRLLVPKDLVLFATITKEVVFASAVNIIEIWDKDLYEKSINGDAIDFAALVQDVMGNTNDNHGVS